MNNTPNNSTIISDFHSKIDRILKYFSEIAESKVDLSDEESVRHLEKTLQTKARELADQVAALHLQNSLDSNTLLNSNEKKLIKGYPKKFKNRGKRNVTVTMLGGTRVQLSATYYSTAAKERKKKKGLGLYPALLLLGLNGKFSPGLNSLLCRLSSAACSFDEASKLVKHQLGFKVHPNKLRQLCKHFAARIKACREAGNFRVDEDFSGRTIGVSTDGGRTRIRKKKRGRKTRKNRHRYKTDWKEPKLIVIYVIGKNGEKERTISPIIDSSLDGPDAMFSLLIYYLKQVNVKEADKVVFVSDGAKWIWERAAKLSGQLGLAKAKFFMVLDFYHAVEHLSSMASETEWSAKKRKCWVKKQKKRLLKGELDVFMEEVKQVFNKRGSDQLRREYQYFKSHQAHMKYAEIRQLGLPIGSGAVESAIRRVINMRLKGPGIFWHKDMANAMLMLRSYYKAERWEVLEKSAYLGGLAI